MTYDVARMENPWSVNRIVTSVQLWTRTMSAQSHKSWYDLRCFEGRKPQQTTYCELACILCFVRTLQPDFTVHLTIVTGGTDRKCAWRVLRYFPARGVMICTTFSGLFANLHSLLNNGACMELLFIWKQTSSAARERFSITTHSTKCCIILMWCNADQFYNTKCRLMCVIYILDNCMYYFMCCNV